MKKSIILAAFAATALLVGCNKEDVNTSKSGLEVKLMIGGVQTKTSTNPADNTTTFSEGDKVGVFSVGLLETEMNNVLHTVGANAELSTTDPTEYLYDSDNATANFHAYYPYSSSQVNGTTVSFTVSGQSDADSFNANDFLTTPDGGVAGTPEGTVALNFNHRLSLVKVVWTPGTDATVKLNHILPTVNWDYNTGAVALAADAPATEIAMWEAKDNEYWALIPAQTFQSAADKSLLTVTVGAKTYALNPTISVPFNEGKTKKITLSIEDEKLVATIANVGNIGNWDTSEEEEQLDEIISAANGNFSNTELGTAKNGIKDVLEAGWFPVSQATYAAVSIDNEELKIVNTGTSVMGGNNNNTEQNAWYRRAVVYRSTDIPKATSYTLKFKVKATKGEDGKTPKIQVAVMVPESQTNTFFKLGSVTNFNYFEPGEAYIEKTYMIDLSNAGTNSTTAANPDVSKGIVLLFASSNIDNATYYIDDVSIIETPLDGTAVSVE